MRSFIVIPTLITLASAAPVLRRADATDSAAAAASTDASASSSSSGIVGGLESAAVGALKSLLEKEFPELAGVLDALNIRELAARAADDATATDSAASAAATDAASSGSDATSAIIKDVVDAIKTFVESKDPALAGILDALPIRRADDESAVDDAGDAAATDDASATDSASDSTASATDSASSASATDAAASSSSSVNPIVKDIVDALKSAIEAKVPELSGILDALPIRRADDAEAVDDAGDVAATDSASDAAATDSASDAQASATDSAASATATDSSSSTDSSSVNPIVKDIVDALKSLVESKVPELSGILDALPIKKRDTADTVKTIVDAIKPLIEAKFPEIAGLLDALPVKRADDATDATSTDSAAAATSTSAAASSSVDPKVKIIGDVVDALKSFLESKFPQITNIIDPVLGRSLNDLD